MKRMGMVLLALLVLCTVGCAKPADELTPVALHEVTRSVFYAPQYVAASLGYFEDAGLDVSITTSGGSDKAMTALLSGEADICLAGPETGVYVYNEGRENAPVIVGQLTSCDGSFLLAREPDADFAYEKLEGKSVIGGRKGGMPIMTLLYVLGQHGLIAGENVEVIDSIQFNLMAGAFESGMGDYVTLFEPTATEFQNAGKGFIVSSVGQASGRIPYTAYLVTPDKLASDRGTVKAFLTAIHRAQEWIVTASDADVAAAMQPFFPDTPLESLMIVSESYRAIDAWKTEPEMFESDYDRLLDVIAYAGELTARPPFGELVDNTLAREVAE